MVIPAQPNELYVAAQFHLHLASEHTINGLFSSAELHIVHLREGGTLSESNDAAVLGFKIDAGAQTTNELYEYFLCGWENAAGISTEQCNLYGNPSNGPFDLYELFLNEVADDWSTFTYDGGLTNPPCLEVVQVSISILFGGFEKRSVVFLPSLSPFYNFHSGTSWTAPFRLPLRSTFVPSTFRRRCQVRSLPLVRVVPAAPRSLWVTVPSHASATTAAAKTSCGMPKSVEPPSMSSSTPVSSQEKSVLNLNK